MTLLAAALMAMLVTATAVPLAALTRALRRLRLLRTLWLLLLARALDVGER